MERLVEVPERQVEGLHFLPEAPTQMVVAEKQIKETETTPKIDQKTREVIFLNHFFNINSTVFF